MTAGIPLATMSPAEVRHAMRHGWMLLWRQTPDVGMLVQPGYGRRLRHPPTWFIAGDVVRAIGPDLTGGTESHYGWHLCTLDNLSNGETL